ncbi:hypothetical protein BT93_C0728 [Corymbia citriodora subsp. variegata]|nr:hypothetical protein BT93_C0728 [Corymbia citriodora subsp. variegata]
MVHISSLFVTLLRSIWKSRNRTTFADQPPNPLKTVEEAVLQHRLTEKWSNQDKSTPVPQLETWAPPEVGSVKINIDAAWRSSSKEGAIAGVCRDDKGTMIAGFSSSIHAPSPLVAETLALRAALRWIHENRTGTQSAAKVFSSIPHVVISADNSAAVRSVLGLEEPSWAVKALVQDCCNLLGQMQGIQLMYEPRSNNTVANWVAKAYLNGTLTPN